MSGRNATGLSRLVRLFLVAYAPLALIVAIQTSRDWWSGEVRTCVFWAAAIWSVVGISDAWRLPRGALRKGSIQSEFYDIQDQSGAIAGYLATFLLPFVGLQLNTIRESLGVVVFFVVVLAIFVQSDLAAVNPTLYLVGFRVVRARVRTSGAIDPIVVVLIPRRSRLATGQPVPVVSLGDFYICR